MTGSCLCGYLSRCSCSAAGQCLRALLGWRRIKDRVLNRRFGLFVWRRLWRGHCSWLTSRLMLTCLALGVNTPQSSLFPSRGAAQTRTGENLLWFHILVINWTCILTKAEVSSHFLFFLPPLYTANALSALLSLWLHISSLCPPASNLSLAPHLQSLLVQGRMLVFFWKSNSLPYLLPFKNKSNVYKMIAVRQPAILLNHENKGIKRVFCKIWAVSQKCLSLPFFFSFLSPQLCHLHSH